MRTTQEVTCSDGEVRIIDASTVIPDKWLPTVPVEESAPPISEDEVPGLIDPLEEEVEVSDEDSFSADDFADPDDYPDDGLDDDPDEDPDDPEAGF